MTLTNNNSPQSFAIRYLATTDEDIGTLVADLRNSPLSGESPLIDKYEASLSEFFGARHAIAVNSGSSALHCALAAVGVGPGTEVLIPATAPLPSLLPILTAGAVPRVVDVDPTHLGFDVCDLQSKINSRTRAALAVILWGYPQDLLPSLKILNEYQIPLVEDACQAHGTNMNGKSAGRIGLVGCFSTHDYKLLSTGEGGFVITDDVSLAARIRRFAHLGDLDGHHHGVNYKLSGLAASLGTARLQRLPRRLEAHRENARGILARLRSGVFADYGACQLGLPNYYTLILQVNLPADRARQVISDCNHKGLTSDKQAFGYDLVYRRPLFFDGDVRCPNAERVLDTTVQLPCHPGLTSDDCDHIATILTAATNRAAASK